uniref:Adenosylcobinamide kinase n=1 Tax=Thermosporothrix sp. COM3 TaxID=2490863 RepID=A0A455SLI6_9CHLR|nr:adenosylcobinamide kinase/adenosylcobinamide phosphate guanyltransferase [Thermosporothrix sp. COM3]
MSEPVKPPRLILVLGGARSGKSSYAELLAARSGCPVAYIATATADDNEMSERIRRHQDARPAEWVTIEEPYDLEAAFRRGCERADVVLLDCVTLWVSNWLLRDGRLVEGEQATAEALFNTEIVQQVDKLLRAFAEADESKRLILVSNEVGLGLVPPYPIGRVYRDTLGRVNMRLARAADAVYLLVAGLPLDVRRLRAEMPW